MDLEANNPIILAVIAVLVVGAIFFIQSNQNPPTDVPIETITFDKTGFQIAPDLQGIKGYINTDESISLKDLKGKVVLIDFWTYSCINCIRTLPFLKDWDDKYSDDGLVIIGVHSPEFEFEKDYDNVLKAVTDNEIEYAVVQDNDFVTWRAYQNRFWPHKFLIDHEGYIRYDHIGEGSYDVTEKKIVELLQEKDASIQLEESSGLVTDTDFSQIGSPEIYFGTGFIRAPLGNFEYETGFGTGDLIGYTLPDQITPNLAYFQGSWQTFNDFSRLGTVEGQVILHYKAKNLNIVAGSLNESILRVTLDGNPLDETNKGDDAELVDGEWVVKVKEEKLYNVVSNVDYSDKTIVIKISGMDFELYTFTFG